MYRLELGTPQPPVKCVPGLFCVGIAVRAWH